MFDLKLRGTRYDIIAFVSAVFVNTMPLSPNHSALTFVADDALLIAAIASARSIVEYRVISVPLIDSERSRSMSDATTRVTADAERSEIP